MANNLVIADLTSKVRLETYIIRRKANHTIAYGATFTSREAAEMKRLEIDRDDELEVV